MIVQRKKVSKSTKLQVLKRQNNFCNWKKG